MGCPDAWHHIFFHSETRKTWYKNIRMPFRYDDDDELNLTRPRCSSSKRGPKPKKRGALAALGPRGPKSLGHMRI